MNPHSPISDKADSGNDRKEPGLPQPSPQIRGAHRPIIPGASDKMLREVGDMRRRLTTQRDVLAKMHQDIVEKSRLLKNASTKLPPLMQQPLNEKTAEVLRNEIQKCIQARRRTRLKAGGTQTPPPSESTDSFNPPPKHRKTRIRL